MIGGPSAIAAYEKENIELFSLFRENGWLPGNYCPPYFSKDKKKSWQHASTRANTFFPNYFTHEILLELEGLQITSRIDRNPFFFYPNKNWAYLKKSRVFDLKEEVEEIIESEWPSPIVDGDGQILFVGQNHRSCFLDIRLCAYMRASNPFTLLSYKIFGKKSPEIEFKSVEPGERVTGRPWVFVTDNWKI